MPRKPASPTFPVALRIIGYLTHERRLAFTKKAIEGGGYTDTQEVYFEPQGKRQFTGPVYYLQSDYTVSAVEIFSLAMMALPNVTRVGTPTYGILSDSLEKKLPNGWSIGLSNEVYVAVDGNLYEGRGIPPNIEVKAQTTGNFHERMRLDIDTALALIGKANTKSR
jgi:carboxyl-terminal processing protease